MRTKRNYSGKSINSGYTATTIGDNKANLKE